jgi:hypothetical protein
VISGGVLCLLGLIGVWRLYPELRDHVHDRPASGGADAVAATG